MWALNLMKYRERADYADGRQTDPLVRRLTRSTSARASGRSWLSNHSPRSGAAPPRGRPPMGSDRYRPGHRDRVAMIEMNASKAFQVDEQHKDAGDDFTTMAAFPIDDDPVPPQESGAGSDRLLLLQVSGDASAPDLAEGIDATRVGRFWLRTGPRHERTSLKLDSI